MRKFIFLTFLLLLLIPNTILAIEISSPNAILIDCESGKVLYEKGSDILVYPASTTKIMTAIMAFENCDLEDSVTASYNAVMSVPSDGTIAAIQVGETWTVGQLIDAMMICSANEAANIIAEHIGGNIESFVSMMNSRAKELGATSTNFVNANGLHDDKHQTTVHDMAILARYAMNTFPAFKESVSKQSFSLPKTSKYIQDRIFSNTNKLIIPSSTYYYEYATGIKTGYTSKALNCIVASAEKNGVELIAVVFNSVGASNRTSDVKALFEYGFEQLKSEKFFSKGDTVKEIKISGATPETSTLIAVTSKDIVYTIPSNKDISDYTPEIKINENLKAPIKNGETVGTIYYNIEGTDYESELIASNDVASIFNSVATVAVKTTKAIAKVIFWAVLSVIGMFIALILIRVSVVKKKMQMRSRRRAIYNRRFR